jgi:hypothetical protein
MQTSPTVDGASRPEPTSHAPAAMPHAPAAVPQRSTRRATARRASDRRATARQHKDDIDGRIIDDCRGEVDELAVIVSGCRSSRMSKHLWLLREQA